MLSTPPSSLIRHVRGVALTAPWLAYLLLADVALSLMLPFKALAPRLVYNLSSRLAGSVWTWIQFIFERLNGARIVCSGDALPAGESAIVVANHQAWADFYMIQALAARAGMLGRCRYFAKRQLRFVPFLGWGLWAMGMPMVSRNWLKDKSGLDRAFAGLVSKRLPTCKSFLTPTPHTYIYTGRVIDPGRQNMPVIYRAYQLQRGYALQQGQVSSVAGVVQEHRSAPSHASLVSPHQGLHRHGPASPAGTTHQGCVRPDHLLPARQQVPRGPDHVGHAERPETQHRRRLPVLRACSQVSD